jgi:hypothetical protein
MTKPLVALTDTEFATLRWMQSVRLEPTPAMRQLMADMDSLAERVGAAKRRPTVGEEKLMAQLNVAYHHETMRWIRAHVAMQN